MKITIIQFIICTSISLSFSQTPITFVHPGAVNSKADLDFVKAKIAAKAQPWMSTFNKMLPLATAGNSITAPLALDVDGQKSDAQKAYANALAWYYTGTDSYAQNAIGILNVWGKTFAGYEPDLVGQNQLQGGWIGAMLAPAAEIMRGYSGWNATDLASVQAMFKKEFYPVLNTMSTWNGNVDLTQIDAMMNIAVFCEDEAEFKLGLQRLKSRNLDYFYLKSDGTNPNAAWWFNPTNWVDGITQETCRDNGHHAQYAMASALHAAEVAWNQGVDVYTENTERYTATLELMANQMLTGEMGTCKDNVTTKDLYDTWEVGFNHYFNRKGISLPFTEDLIKTRVRNSSYSDWNIFFESLTHNLDGTGIYDKCPKPNLGNSQSICGLSNIVLDSKLPSTGKTFKWFKDKVLLPTEIGNTLTISSAGAYVVTVDSTNCTLSDIVIIKGQLFSDLGGNKELCKQPTLTFDAGSATVPNVSYLWNNGSTAKNITVNKPGNYSVTVSAQNCPSVSSSSTVTTRFISVETDTLCVKGSSAMSVIGGASVKWYDSPINGNLLFTGNVYEPTISSSTTFYVESTGLFENTFGKTERGTGEVWNLSGTDFGAEDKIFKASVTQALTLKSISVYNASANSSITINFMKGTAKAYTKTFSNVPAGKQTLLLNFDLLPGDYVVNALGSTATLGFEAADAAFPYSIPGYMSFTYNASWQDKWYGLFYDWKIVTSINPCLRTPVQAIIDETYANCVTGLNENTIDNKGAFLNIYPNPATNQLFIDCKQDIRFEKVEVYASTGQLVMTRSFNNTQNTLDISNLSKGIYSLTLTGEKTISLKFIKTE